MSCLYDVLHALYDQRYRQEQEAAKHKERERMEASRQEALLEQQKRLEELKKRIPNYDKIQAIGTDTDRLQQDTVAFKVSETRLALYAPFWLRMKPRCSCDLCVPVTLHSLLWRQL